MNEQSLILEASHLRRVYRRGTEEVMALDDVSLSVGSGEFVSFIGPSGSGKTTLINILGCLDNATSGSLRLHGDSVFSDSRALSERELTRIRRRTFGYIFQKFYLVPTLNVLENVLLPLVFFRNEGAGDARRLLRSLGLEDRLTHRPGELSGGEMQRVAIARALVNRPRILLADEPTGNLDSARSLEIAAVLKKLSREEGLTVLLVTHNPALAAFGDRTILLRDGRIAAS